MASVFLGRPLTLRGEITSPTVAYRATEFAIVRLGIESGHKGQNTLSRRHLSTPAPSWALGIVAAGLPETHRYCELHETKKSSPDQRPER